MGSRCSSPRYQQRKASSCSARRSDKTIPRQLTDHSGRERRRGSYAELPWAMLQALPEFLYGRDARLAEWPPS